METTYEHGTYNALCDRCGFKFKAKKLRLEWNGLRTCSGAGTNDCWEIRHPQDFVKGKADKQSPDWVRPEPADLDVSPGSGNEITADDL